MMLSDSIIYEHFSFIERNQFWRKMFSSNSLQFKMCEILRALIHQPYHSITIYGLKSYKTNHTSYVNNSHTTLHSAATK